MTQKKQHFGGKMDCDVGIIIDRVVAEKKCENKVEMSSY